MKNNKFTWLITIVLCFAALIYAKQKISALYNLWKYRLEIQVINAEIEKPLETSLHFPELAPANISNIQEINTLVLEGTPENIVTLAESPNRDYLLVVYSSGLLKRWDVKNRVVVSQLEIGAASRQGTNFNKNGNWILTPGKVNRNNTISGYKIFNTETGKLVECFSSPDCVGEYEDEGSYGQVLSPNAQLLMDYKDSYGEIRPKLAWEETLSFGSVGIGASDCLFLNGFDDFHRSLDFRRIIFSPSQKYIAYTLENGVVCVRDASEMSGIDMGTGNELPFAPGPQPPFKKLRFHLSDDQNIDARALEISPTNRWLAALSSSELMVWDLENFFSPEKIKFPISNGNALSFDQTGNLLAVGTTDKLIIFNVTKGNQIAEYPTAQITTLYFTRDNRLLIWGDTEGNVHLWGVPQK